MEKICKWLFGEELITQEEKIKKLLYWTLGMLVVMVILIFIEPALAEAVIAIIFLMWGWRVVLATAKVNKITELFNYNIAIFVVILILWLMFGYLAGIVCFILGIIRYIQLRRR